MGWFHDDYPDHEGFLVGYVVREGCSPGSGQYRELASPLDVTTRSVERIAGGCDCGWRSPRWSPSTPAAWAPFQTMAGKVDDEHARQLWSRHLVLDVGGDRRAGAGAARVSAPCGADLLCIEDARKPDGIWHEAQCPLSDVGAPIDASAGPGSRR